MQFYGKIIIVKGLVQGVSFRDTAKMKAIELGVLGYVKNNFDGDVEIVAYGKEEDIEKLVVWCHTGPPAAKVESVSVNDIELSNKPKNFQIIY